MACKKVDRQYDWKKEEKHEDHSQGRCKQMGRENMAKQVVLRISLSPNTDIIHSV